MIKEIMGKPFTTLNLNGLKKFENKMFVILQFKKHSVVLDKRHTLPQIHSSINSAYNTIVKKEMKKEKMGFDAKAANGP